ncbi:hypothetical protein IQ06DRAFT_108331 [Phaeosphaeriaceae sp. SRC1lsM3a]|nr:hypothetical protein IQ06DRAFT_108331 [Stagonospora sp. SRC1lsM3a]
MADSSETPVEDAASEAPAAPLLTTQAKVKNWQKQVYHQHFFKNGQNINVDVEDLLKITSLNAPDCYIAGEVLCVALDLITEERSREDIVVLSDFTMQLLHSVGTAEETVESTLAQYPTLYDNFLDGSVRWIITPCSDGSAHHRTNVISTSQANRDQSKGNPADHNDPPVTEIQKDKHTDTNMPRQLFSSIGGHWGLLIVDKTNKVAHWVDSRLTLRTQGGETKIRHMFLPGAVAGKVLAGIDEVLSTRDGFVKGQFDASTLKYTPQTCRHNRTRNDGGACGPFIFAFLRHLYDNPTKLENLKASFSRRKLGNLIFNSEEDRKAIQNLIRQGNESEEELPFMLTCELLYALNVISGEHLKRVVDKFQGKTQDPPGGLGGNYGSNGSGSGGGGGGGIGGHNNDKYNGDDLDEDFKDTGITKGTLIEFIREDTGYYSKCKTWDAKFQLALDTLLAAQKDQDEEANRRKEPEQGNESTKGRHRGRHSRNWTIQYPEGFHRDNLPNFATLTSQETNIWQHLFNRDLFDMPGILGLSYPTIRSVMHRTYKGRFDNESYDSLQHHLTDRIAFDPDEYSKDPRDGADWTAETLTRRLNETYIDLNVPNFATLSDPDIDLWVERLPPDTWNLLKTPGTSTNRPTLYNRARGMLHRMFVGELDEMSPDDITRWRRFDPSIIGHSKVDNETAMVVMKILYDGDDVQDLPWLRESPLHWPSRRHFRIKHSEKRKRDNDKDTDQDHGSKRPKNRHPDPKNGPGPSTQAGPTSHHEPMDGVLLGSVQWARITDVELEKYLTPEVRNDPRIGEKANKYSYRAVLFVNHGGTFKDESQKGLEIFWARDTNVFTHGHESKGRDFELIVLNDGKVRIQPKQEVVLERMALKYEPDVPTEDVPGVGRKESTSGDGGNLPGSEVPSNGPSNGHGFAPEGGVSEKNSDDPANENGADAPRDTLDPHDLEGLSEHTPNFSRVSTEIIASWVEKNPFKVRFGRGVWDKRTALQHLFGGLEELPDEDFDFWMSRDERFKKQRKAKDWGKRRFMEEIMQRLTNKGKGVTQPKGDLQGKFEYYPTFYYDYYRKYVLKEPAKASTDESAVQTPGKTTRSSSKRTDSSTPQSATPAAQNVAKSGTDSTTNSSKKTTPGAENSASSPQEPVPATQQVADTIAQQAPGSTVPPADWPTSPSVDKASSPPAEHTEITRPSVPAPDFLTLTNNELDQWLEMLPKRLHSYLKDPEINDWDFSVIARLWLTRIFTRRFQDMAAESELSDTSFDTVYTWLKAFPEATRMFYMPRREKVTMLKFLKDRLLKTRWERRYAVPDAKNSREMVIMSDVEEVELPDWSEDASKWPEGWRGEEEDE